MDFWLQNNVEYHDRTNSKHSAETNYSAPEEKLQGSCEGKGRQTDSSSVTCEFKNPSPGSELSFRQTSEFNTKDNTQCK